MNDDPIASQIENLGYRRLAGCAFKFALLVVACGIALGVVAKHTRDRATITSAMLAFSGLVFGFATAFLTPGSRRVLIWAFTVGPMVLALIMFAHRTLLGSADSLPLRMVLAPLALTVGFLIGQVRKNAQW